MNTVTPSTTRKLLEKGFNVNVERSPTRIFDDEEYERVGAKLVSEGSWPNVPIDHIIIGLKELPDEDCTASINPLSQSSLTNRGSLKVPLKQ